MSKKLKILFTISVLLNLAFIGIVVGHGLKRYHDSPWQEFRQQLSPETQAVMRKTFEDKKDRIFSAIRTMREKKKNLVGIISAPEFNVQAFDAAVQDWQGFNQKMMQGKMETFKGILTQLPQGERQKLARRFVDVLTGQGHPRKDTHKKRDVDQVKTNTKE